MARGSGDKKKREAQINSRLGHGTPLVIDAWKEHLYNRYALWVGWLVVGWFVGVCSCVCVSAFA